MHVVIDERLLNDDELVEYGRINKLSFSENHIVVLVILGLTYPALTVFLGVQSEQLKGDSSDLDSLFSLLALVALVTGWMGPFWAWNRGSEKAKRARDERRGEFRQSLSGYDYRRMKSDYPASFEVEDQGTAQHSARCSTSGTKGTLNLAGRTGPGPRCTAWTSKRTSATWPSTTTIRRPAPAASGGHHPRRDRPAHVPVRDGSG